MLCRFNIDNTKERGIQKDLFAARDYDKNFRGENNEKEYYSGFSVCSGCLNSNWLLSFPK
jgi:hypothetical protein